MQYSKIFCENINLFAFQVEFGEIPPGKMGRLMFSEKLFFRTTACIFLLFSPFYRLGIKNSKIVLNSKKFCTINFGVRLLLFVSAARIRMALCFLFSSCHIFRGASKPCSTEA